MTMLMLMMMMLKNSSGLQKRSFSSLTNLGLPLLKETRETPSTALEGIIHPIPLWASYRERGHPLQELRQKGMIPGMVSDYHVETGNQFNDFIALQRKEIWGHLTRMGRKEFMSRFYELQLREHPDSDKVERTIKVHPSKVFVNTSCSSL